MKNRFLLAVTALIFSIPAAAKEGFSKQKDQLPPSVQRAWESTFLLHWMSETSGSTATAFLVAAISAKSVTDLYFLTNAHTLPANCEATKTCGRIHLVQEAKLSISATAGPQYTIRDGLILEIVDVALASQNPDLALVHGRVPKETALPAPLKIASQCRLTPGQPLYTIGFADSALRSSDHQAAEPITKRWSEGVFVNYLNLDLDGLKQTVSGTTVDVLKGGSGGPLLTANGEIAGVMQINATGPAKQYRYVGVEAPEDQRSPHSAAAPCEYLSLFIEAGIRMQQTRAKIPEV